MLSNRETLKLRHLGLTVSNCYEMWEPSLRLSNIWTTKQFCWPISRLRNCIKSYDNTSNGPANTATGMFQYSWRAPQTCFRVVTLSWVEISFLIWVQFVLEIISRSRIGDEELSSSFCHRLYCCLWPSHPRKSFEELTKCGETPPWYLRNCSNNYVIHGSDF